MTTGRWGRPFPPRRGPRPGLRRGLAALAVAAWALLSAGPSSAPSAGDEEPPPAPAPDRAPEAKPERPSPEEVKRKGCTASGCHGDLLKAEWIHGPVAVKACNTCHKIDDPERHTYRLARDERSLCLHCHGELEEPAHMHKPFAEGKCTECHDPHGGRTRALLAGESEAALCRRCHDPVTGRKASAHGPAAAGECAACHAGHGSAFPKLLSAPARDTCLSCHQPFAEELAKARVVHDPVKTDCLACHEAHESDLPHQLRAPAPELCTPCHTDVQDEFAGAAVKHGAIESKPSCLACHNPHGSQLKALLDAPPMDLCLRCHDRPIETGHGTIANMRELLEQNPYPHGPVAQKNCTACHRPHDGTHFRLLAQEYPRAFYAPFQEKIYALCFGCHNKELVLVARTEKLTDFRDGDRNLHYLHVNRKPKGRTCRACHEIHASHQPRHIADGVPFGNWRYPLRFRKTDTGGSCFVGCHEELAYDRVHPAGGRRGRGAVRGGGGEKSDAQGAGKEGGGSESPARKAGEEGGGEHPPRKAGEEAK